MDDRTIGARVKAARGSLSQEDVARGLASAGVRWSQTTLSKVELGERPLRLSEAYALGRVLGVPVGVFVGESGGDARACLELERVLEFVRGRLDRIDGGTGQW